MKLPQLKRQEIILLGITIFGAFLIANWLLLRPWMDAIRVQKEDLAKLQKEVANWKEDVEKADGRKVELEKLSQNIDLNAAHIRSPESWTKHFESVASDTGIKIINTTPKLQGNQMEATWVIEGSVESIARFLHQLLTDSSHPRVTSCRLRPKEPGKDEIQANLKISVILKPGGAK